MTYQEFQDSLPDFGDMDYTYDQKVCLIHNYANLLVKVADEAGQHKDLSILNTRVRTLTEAITEVIEPNVNHLTVNEFNPTDPVTSVKFSGTSPCKNCGRRKPIGQQCFCTKEVRCKQ